MGKFQKPFVLCGLQENGFSEWTLRFTPVVLRGKRNKVGMVA
jgi:hypothetical protein